MMSAIKSLFYAVFHRGLVRLTVVRRYTDAQGNFIGELYIGEGRDARMVGMACDTLPFDIGAHGGNAVCRLEFGGDFLTPMGPGGLRVGSQDPRDNEAVRRTIMLRRYCPLRITILNRFVEHVMEPRHAG